MEWTALNVLSKKRKDDLLSLIYEEAKYETDVQVQLDVCLYIRTRHHEREHEEGRFSTLSMSSYSDDMNDDNYETINENNINKVLSETVTYLKHGIHNLSRRFYGFGIQSFGLRLIMKSNF